jgi:hypothetical protein
MIIYTYNTSIYLEKDGKNAAQMVTATNATVKSITISMEEFCCKLHMDSFFLLLSRFI